MTCTVTRSKYCWTTLRHFGGASQKTSTSITYWLSHCSGRGMAQKSLWPLWRTYICHSLDELMLHLPYTIIKRFWLFIILFFMLGKSLSCLSARLHLFDQKYSKTVILWNCIIVINVFVVAAVFFFCILVYFQM